MTVNVTLCKDCVHFKRSHCKIWDRTVGTHDFCSNGRPKNNIFIYVNNNDEMEE